METKPFLSLTMKKHKIRHMKYSLRCRLFLVKKKKKTTTKQMALTILILFTKSSCSKISYALLIERPNHKLVN